MEFDNATVVVTGGTRGIGRAISLAFASQGAQVFAAYLNNDEAARSLESDSRALPGKVTPLKADVSASEGGQYIMNAASAESGHIDVLVNNAGIIRDGFLTMMADDDWDAVIRTNLYPLFHCTKWAVRKMLGRRRGAIITISSIAALTGTSGQTNYAATKGAAISFTKSLARELGPLGIRANSIVAGLIETEMTSSLKKNLIDTIVSTSALGRIGKPEEIADAVLFLASTRSSYITGQSLIVDGGIV